jgi:hypothetical protein
MRGSERPAKVRWTRPFLLPLQPLTQDAARKTFVDITDDLYNTEDIDKILLLTDNMPLAIDLMAHLVDSEGCYRVLARWEEERTSLVSDGYNKQSNLDLSISLSLSSPRLTSIPNTVDLLSILSILPDGISDNELLQCDLHIKNILTCKASLLRTSLAYNTEQKRLKVLLPIREYMQKFHPAPFSFVHPILTNFQNLLELYDKNVGRLDTSEIVAQITTNLANIHSIFGYGLQNNQPDINRTIYCIIFLNRFCSHTQHGSSPLMTQIQNILASQPNHRLGVYLATALLGHSRQGQSISTPEALIEQSKEQLGHITDPDLKSKWYSHNIHSMARD